MTQEGNPQIETINFDGDSYEVEALTPRVLEGFNMLVRVQQDVQEQAYQLKKSQAAQGSIAAEIKAMIAEDKIKPVENEINDTSTE
jgi:hypothetical protein